MVLYYHDHTELNRLRQLTGVTSHNNINHKQRLEKRKVRLKEVCETFNDATRVEYRKDFIKTVTAT